MPSEKPSTMLGPEGVFSQKIPGFKARDGQRALSDAIDEALRQRRILIAEAGTGIGKTYAYLLPALRSGAKLLISTGTRHLQDQLYHKDLPQLRKVLGSPVRTALLKGRANYICPYRLDLAKHQPFHTLESRHQLRIIEDWGRHSTSGDIAELSDVPEESPLWPMVTSTADNCLGTECSRWQDCFVVKARRTAQSADIVVINHHLLMADMVLKEEGFGELLPLVEGFIIDEAHQLPDVASLFFSKTVSSRQILGLVKDTIAEHLQDAPDMADLRQRGEALNKAVMDFRLVLGVANDRGSWRKIATKPEVSVALEELSQTLARLVTTLELAAPRGKGLAQCHQRGVDLLARLTLLSKPQSDHVQWYETFTRSFILHMTPLEIAGPFQSQMRIHPKAWIFTSATLQVSGDFSHFADRLGLADYDAGCWVSPFDYQRQSLLYLPPGLPEPAADDYTRRLVNDMISVLQASQGRAFMLFTSYRALREAAGLLKDRLEYPLLIQGDQPKRMLIETFKALGNAVLLGTSSFWEGVDVPGEALSCVIIDKLPFSSPSEPVLQARLEAVREAGGNPFMDYQLPQAVIALKQGVGRLIRDINDRGVLVIADPRLRKKHYGRIFFDSLPPIPVTTDIREVAGFFQEHEIIDNGFNEDTGA